VRIKFQIFKAEEICSEKSDFFNLFKSLELSSENWHDLADFARSLNILFSASVFGDFSADLLDKMGSPLYKVASGDLTHLPLLRYIAQKNKPIILSTGMSSLCEIEEAINSIYSEGNNEVALMHCVSNYPTKYYESNLNVIQTLNKVFKVPVGFSDHTIGTVIPALAVILGADLIEKHFTLDHNLHGHDHKMSLEPDEFRKMVNNIRIAEKSLGNGIKSLTDDEKNLIKFARRCLTAKNDISEGNAIKRDDIKIVRPGSGIEPKFIDFIIGKLAKTDIKKEEPITWDKI